LQTRGHDAVAVDLPAADEHAGLPEYVHIVIDAIGGHRDAVVVAQSMGEFTAPMAAERVPVSLLVLVNAMIPVPGETPGDWWGDTGWEAARVAAAQAGGYPAEVDLDTYFLHDVPADVVATGEGHNRPEAEIAFIQPCAIKTLELGGKSAAIILDDADLTASLEPFFGTTLLNNGQICWLCTRVLAPRSRYDAVVETITALAPSLTIGDPLDPATKIGPLVSERQRDRVESYIAKGKADGGRITAGGSRPEGFDRGWFVEPTIFAGVDPKATIAQEEIFGPVLAVIPYADEQEAVAIANDSEYGLGGSVWTADPERGASFARKVRTGTIGVNGYINDPIRSVRRRQGQRDGRRTRPRRPPALPVAQDHLPGRGQRSRLTRQAPDRKFSLRANRSVRPTRMTTVGLGSGRFPARCDDFGRTDRGVG